MKFLVTFFTIFGTLVLVTGTLVAFVCALAFFANRKIVPGFIALGIFLFLLALILAICITIE